MELLFFFAGLVLICTIVLIVGLFTLLRAFILKKRLSSGISLSLLGGIPLLLIFLFVYFGFFYVSDSDCTNMFLSDLGIELPTSTKVIHKDFAPVVWTDYESAFVARLNEKDFLNLLDIFKATFPEKEKKGEDVFLCTSGRDIIGKAGIEKKDVIWFDHAATHHKTVGFHKDKKLLIYSKFRY